MNSIPEQHPSSSGASRDIHKSPKDNDVYMDDVEEEIGERTQFRTSRILALALGIATLAAIAVGAAFFMHREHVSVRKSGSIQSNYEGTIDLATVEIHSTPNDCWMVIHGNVYDLTEYAPSHPGGAEWVTDYCGMDATYFYCLYHGKGLLLTVTESLVGPFSNQSSTDASTLSPKPPIQDENPLIISPAMLELHATPDSCWMALYGTVYDLTEYAPRHPAGSEWVTDYCGIDATDDYAVYHTKGLLRSVSDTIVGPFAIATHAEENDSSAKSTNPPTEKRGVDPAGPAEEDEDQRTIRPTRDGISLETVALHSSNDDCWMVLHGNVYDMTEYAPEHPAGPEWVTDYCGIDATNDYAVYHGEGLLRSVSETLVGPLTEAADLHDGFRTDKSTIQPTDPPTEEKILLPTDSPTIKPTKRSSPPAQDDFSNGVDLETLALHSSSDDCWMVLHGNVYDLTEYAPTHPAGSEWVTDYCGIDATDDYAVYHGRGMLRSVSSTIVGPLVEATAFQDGEWTDKRTIQPTDPPTEEKILLPTDSPTIKPTSSPPAQDDFSNGIRLETVALHSSSNDCWMVLHGNVYDLTEYAPTHPGGRRWVTNYCGIDATNDYAIYHRERLLQSVSDSIVGEFLDD